MTPEFKHFEVSCRSKVKLHSESKLKHFFHDLWLQLWEEGTICFHSKPINWHHPRILLKLWCTRDNLSPWSSVSKSNQTYLSHLSILYPLILAPFCSSGAEFILSFLKSVLSLRCQEYSSPHFEGLGRGETHFNRWVVRGNWGVARGLKVFELF